jgi:transglutaminase-like putative cysteine protease
MQLCALFCPFVFFISAAYAQNFTGVDTAWLPITDAEQNMKAPQVDKNAGVEAIFLRTHVWDEINSQDWQRVFVHYVRLKVFNDAGVKRATSIEIPYGNQVGVQSIVGRTIQPDGTIVELQKSGILDRDVVRASGLKIKAKTLSMPGVVPGSIVEYRWREIHFKTPIRYLRAQLQLDYPVQQVTYFVRPLSHEYIAEQMRVAPFNCKPSPLKQGNDGFTSISLENVPAFHDEPYMPGEPNVRPWILFFYTADYTKDPKKYWNKEGKDIYHDLKQSVKVNDEIRAAAEKATSGAKDEPAKVAGLIQYIRANERNLFDDSVTPAERAAIIKSMPKERRRNSAEVFKSGIGTADELNTLFAAMAQSVGLEARPVRIADRNNLVFNPGFADSYFLDNVDMAVKIGSEWKIYDVSTKLLPPDMISWAEEGMPVLLSDPSDPQFIQAKISAPEASYANRAADFKLSPEGDLEGDVHLVYTGHTAGNQRGRFVNESEEKQRESVKQQVNAVWPTAEVSAIKLSGVSDTTQPLSLEYHIKLSGYAERTGKRVLFSPLFFQAGVPPRFTASERNYDIAFQNAWHDVDLVTFELPAGFEFDNAENPGNITFDPVGEYKLTLAVTKDARTLHVRRDLVFGRNGTIMFPKASYDTLKKIFDNVHQNDAVMLSLKAAAPAGTGK